jgi:transcriptional regulator with XRE-family HTH domain
VPTISKRQRQPFFMLAPPSSFEAGSLLRAKRERLHLSIRRVAKISQKIAEEKNDPAFYVPHNWISDLENGKSKPRLAKFHSLSLIYDCDINEILALFGLNIADLGKERGHVTLPHTHLSGLPLTPSESLVVAAPQLPVPIRHLRYPQDAEIVGRVIGFAHRIAQVQPRTVSIPSPGTGLL